LSSFLLKLFVKDCKNTKDLKVRESYGTLGSVFCVVCNIILFIIKFTLGTLSGAVSILADAFNNLADIGTSVVTLLGFKLSRKPADPDHPFGHGRMEYISAFIVAVLIILVGAELLQTSIGKIFSPQELTLSIWVIIGLVASIIIKLYMGFFSKKLGKAIDSGALKASAQDSLNDCISTSCILITMLICHFTNLNIDPYMGILVAIFILKAGIDTVKDTVSPLLGEPPSKELIDTIKKIIFKNEEFKGIHDLIVHNYGPGRIFASVHVEVPETINIVYCHELIDACELEIKNTLGIEFVIHMDPLQVDDNEVMKLREQVQTKVKEIDERLTIHDFRVCEGENRTNLVFDTVIPTDFKMSGKELKEKISEKVREIDKKYWCVIEIDIDFTGQ